MSSLLLGLTALLYFNKSPSATVTPVHRKSHRFFFQRVGRSLPTFVYCTRIRCCHNRGQMFPARMENRRQCNDSNLVDDARNIPGTGKVSRIEPPREATSNGLKHVRELLPDEFDHLIGSAVVTRKDLAFTHSLFVQCFLPMRALPKSDNQHWEVTHGRASIAIEAGRLADPQIQGHWEVREVPAGPKARLLFAYINDFAIRHNTPVIDLGKSLRAFMEKNRVPIGGPNGHELSRQLKNIAAARILLGNWGDTRVSTRQTRIAAGIDFWIDRHPKQSSLMAAADRACTRVLSSH